MPTQRPFLSNFLAAFRAHSQPLPKTTPSLSSSATIAASAQTIWTTASTQKPQSAATVEPSSTSARPINPKATGYNAVTTTSAQDRQLHTSLSPLQHNVSPQTHLPRSPSSPGLPIHGPQARSQSSYPTCQEARPPWSESRKTRRGSDSSADSGGFREVKGGGEKWFIGGRTATGEERYYKLSMIKRDRSLDRISTDQLSL